MSEGRSLAARILPLAGVLHQNVSSQPADAATEAQGEPAAAPQVASAMEEASVADDVPSVAAAPATAQATQGVAAADDEVPVEATSGSSSPAAARKLPSTSAEASSSVLAGSRAASEAGDPPMGLSVEDTMGAARPNDEAARVDGAGVGVTPAAPAAEATKEEEGAATREAESEEEEGAATREAESTATKEEEEEQVADLEDYGDFGCCICLKLLLEPVSLRCGHTFCRRCLKRALRVNAHCPVCRAPVQRNAAEQAANVLISNLIEKGYSVQLARRKEEEVEEIEEERNLRLPVFVLDLMVFPGQPVVLNVFEERYKLMVRRVVGSNRMFAVQPSVDAVLGTTIEIRNVQALRGDAMLVQGVGRQRYRRTRALEVEPDTHGLHYGTLQVYEDEPIPPTLLPRVQTVWRGLLGLTTRCLDRLSNRQRRTVLQRHGHVPGTNMLAFSMWLASALDASPDLNYQMLTTTGTYDRLRMQVRRLQAIANSNGGDAPAAGAGAGAGAGGAGAGGAGAGAGAGGAGAGAGTEAAAEADTGAGAEAAAGADTRAGTEAGTESAGDGDVGAATPATEATGASTLRPPTAADAAPAGAVADVGEITEETFAELGRTLRPAAVFASVTSSSAAQPTLVSQVVVLAGVLVLIWLFF